jgi:hypothetical protein
VGVPTDVARRHPGRGALPSRHLLLGSVPERVEQLLGGPRPAGFAQHASLAVSLVLVTHDPAQARRLADRVVVLEEGRIVADDPTPEFRG